MEGIVYLLRNEGMPGLIKIGYTSSDLVLRIRSLNNTSVPFDFECFFAARVTNCLQVETLLHQVFADKRVNPKREFFLVEPEQAKAALRLAALEDVTPRNEGTIPDTQSARPSKAWQRDDAARPCSI
jgi:T5orf172 domain